MVFAVREPDTEPEAGRAAGARRCAAWATAMRPSCSTRRCPGRSIPGCATAPGRVPRQPARPHGAAAGSDGDGDGVRGQRGEQSDAPGQPPRAGIRAPAGPPPAAVTAPAPGRGIGTRRRRHGVVARGRAAGHRRRRGHRGGGRRADRAGRAGPVPASARALGRLPLGDPGGTAAGPPRPRRRHRPRHRSRPPCLAPRPCGRRHGRDGRGRTRPRGAPRALVRGSRGGGGIPRSGGRADAGPRSAGTALTRRRPGRGDRRRRSRRR